MKEIRLKDYQKEIKNRAYDWVTNSFAGNPSMTFDKFLQSRKWEMNERNYDVYHVLYPNGLQQRCIVRKSDRSEVMAEFPN